MNLRAALVAGSAAAILMAALLLSEGATHAESCPDADNPPVPTEVAVTTVPIVVASTETEYFVLYVSHDADGETVEYPVRVTLGEDGTTTLAENVSALPSARYRVEKYLIADPADVDGDCIDDITELNDPAGMNPANLAAPVGRAAVIISDHATFLGLSDQRSGDDYYEQQEGRTDLGTVAYLKFVIDDIDTDRPKVYFMNISHGQHHRGFVEAAGLEWNELVRGEMVYQPHLVASDGSQGVYSFFLSPYAYQHSFDTMTRAYTLVSASMPLLNNNIALHLRNYELPYSQDLLPLYTSSRINLVYDQDIFAEISFQALNTGNGYGLLRVADPDEAPHPHDIAIYEALPNNLARVAGVISTEPQTPLSHVNLRAVQNGMPNAFIRGALEDTAIAALIDTYVYYEVTNNGWTLRAATPEEVASHNANSRPSRVQTPERDLSVTSITPLSSITFDDWEAFGVKAANLAALKNLSFPSPVADFPNGFAVPFYFYNEFMKANGFYDDVTEMLADPDFQSDFDVQEDKLKKLRKKIKKGDTPDWIEAALVEMHATYPEGTSLRYRSSTNNEDLPGFNGAGLYDSKTQHPEETEDDGISKSLKQVYASLWNFEAFTQREFQNVDHLTTAMGVLVHPNYSDELANGVGVSFDPVYDKNGWYYVNTQLGEDLVTNPEAHSVPEEMLLHGSKPVDVLATSNLVPQGTMLLSETQRYQLRNHLTVIHDEFKKLYEPGAGERFAMEIEFKITSANVLSIKQARPWVFYVAPPPSDNILATGQPVISGTVQVGETLTAVTSGISDTDGLTNASYAHQWIANDGTSDSDIENASASTYLLAAGDEGKTIRVKVSFTDDAGNEETLTSTATAAVAARPNAQATGAPTSNGTAQVGKTLTASTSGIADTDGLTSVTYSYQWIRNDGTTDTDIQDATGASYTLVDTDAGTTIKVKVSFTDDAGNEEALTSAPTATVVEAVIWESELTVGRDTDIIPVVSGYSIFGDLDGTLSPDRFTIDETTYRIKFLLHATNSLWLSVNEELPMDFTLQIGDSTYLASTSRVPTAQNGVGMYWWFSESPGWSASDSVQVSLITHSKIALGSRQKAPVTGYFGTLPTEHDGNEDVSFRIHFSEGVAMTADALRDHVLSVSGGVVSDVTAVGSANKIWAVSVTPESTDSIEIEIEANQDCGLAGAVCAADGRRLFNPIRLVVPASQMAVNESTPEPQNSPATGAPSINSSAQVDSTLTVETSGIADADGLENVSFTYQWVSNDGSTDTDIVSAVVSTYTVTDDLVGKTVKVKVRFTDDAGHEETLTSTATGEVSAAPSPLTVRLENNPASHNGAGEFTFELRFSEAPKLSYRTLKNHAFAMDGGTVKKAERITKGSNTRWRITVEPDGDGPVIITLPPTEDCNAQGAICTKDGRKLKNRLELTVSGPGNNGREKQASLNR